MYVQQIYLSISVAVFRACFHKEIVCKTYPLPKVDGGTLRLLCSRHWRRGRRVPGAWQRQVLPLQLPLPAILRV